MGRGRAKAKQTKVARQLKYGVPQTDLERLEAELQGRSADEVVDEREETTAQDDDDPYSEYVEDDDEADEDDDED